MKITSFQDFQNYAKNTWFGPGEQSFERLTIPALGVAGEAGEVADKVKKLLRGDDVSSGEIAIELGDTLFYIAILADRLGYSLLEIAQLECDKIYGRRERGTLRGDGDSR